MICYPLCTSLKHLPCVQPHEFLTIRHRFYCIFLEGVYLDRSDQDRKPRFVTGEAPSNTDIAAVCSCGAGDVAQKISRRVIRTLRQLGYLEAGLDAVVATGYDPLGDDASELARTMAASVQQASPLANARGSRCGAWARALAPRASALS